MVTVAGPHGEFDPVIYQLDSGSNLYRVFSGRAGRTATQFNPGIGGRSRFAFFADAAGKTVPVLYAAETQEAAICETLLHDIPVSGGALEPPQYQDKVMALIRPTRDLKLASFMGTGLRRLKATHDQISSTDALGYSATVLWAKAAHEAGLDGAIWMSNRCNADRAVVLFGDRVAESELDQASDFARVFDLGPDRSWLVDFCAPLHIDVRS